MNVLILDGDTIPALSIVRSLGRKGLAVDVASHQSKMLCGYSKYISQTHCYPHPLQDQTGFLGWLDALLIKGSYDLIIPVTERTLVPIARKYHASCFADRITMPSKDALEIVLDKGQSELLAKKCHVPVPKSWSITSLHELESFESQLSYPLVIKPGRSISDTSERIQLTVKYAHNREQLFKISRELLKHTHVVLQDYFSGTGVGIELIANQGELVYAFQHQRLHEMPLTGGGSSYRKSVPVNRELLAASERLVKALKWHGVAMVEFKMNLQSGAFIFIEINGRFWGSLPLALAAGADFPYMLYQLYKDGHISELSPYRPEIACRKLSSDLSWFECVLRKDADPRLVTLPSLRSATSEMLGMFKPKDYLDVQSFSDPMPGLVDLKNIALSYSHRFTDKLNDARYRKSILAKSDYQTIQQRLSTANHVLFLCYGNINRSAVAHVLANQLFDNTSRLSFASAGFHPTPNRPADSRMCDTAKAYNVDMGQCQSTVLTTELINWADIIFVMEADHVKKLANLSESAVQKSFLLGGLCSKHKTIEILDPYNKPAPVYETVYKQIDQAISMLKSAVP